MKSQVSAEFVRGILFAFLVWNAYFYLVHCAWIGIYPFFQPWQFIPAFGFFLFYAILAGAVFFKPAKTSRGVFIFLLLFCLMPFLSLYAQAHHILPGFNSPWTYAFLYSLIVSLIPAGIACLHHRLRHQLQANEG